MKKRFCMLLPAAALLLTMTGSVLSAGGDASDPVVSLSYLEQVFTPELRSDYTVSIHSRLGQAYRDSLLSFTESMGAGRLAAQRAAAGTARSAAGRLLLKQGDVLTLAPGCKLTLKSGSVTADTSYLVDVTHGRTVTKLSALAQKTLYMMGDTDSGELRIHSATCELVIDGVYRLSPGAGPDYGSMAEALDCMGLFQGTGSGYALENSASRAQGLVMFLRILGLEEEALSYTGASPFTDVPKTHWAYPYVAYAYAQGLTSGTSADRFSPDRAITCQHYATFLLRALHYREGSDFTYAGALKDLAALGVFSQQEVDTLSAGVFYRYKLVYLSYYGLFGVDQSTGRLMMNELTERGAVKKTSLSDGLCRVVGQRIS